ncbi:MAG TPA: hypothetical protein VNA14_09445 [Mycobacteriales bacterium]|nr:hypothetical protein [Mycobacteriales bacterium]
MRIRRLAVSAVLMLLVTACGDDAADTDPAASAAPTAVESGTPTTLSFIVDVDGKAEVPTTFLAYFPKALSARPGDTVSFVLQDTGAPHTVAFGAAVDKAISARAVAPKSAETPVEFKAIPPLFPPGPGDALQAGAQPCVLPVGAPPITDMSKPCANTKPTEFTGTDQLFTSGWITSDQPFTFTIGAAAVPGTYNYFCQLHANMVGTLTVVAAGATVPAPAEVTAKGAAEKAAFVAALAPGYAAVKAGKTPQVLAGALGGEGVPAEVDAFGPAEATVAVGGKVTWTVRGPHSIAFNAPADAVGFRLPGSDGAVHRNGKALKPAGGPGQVTGPEGPSSDPIDAGKWNGEGFHSSGLIRAFAKPVTYSMIFTKAGTYKYLCTIHIDMEGTVKVG